MVINFISGPRSLRGLHRSKTMNLREENNSGDRAQLRNNSFGVSATGVSQYRRVLLGVHCTTDISSLVLGYRVRNPDRTWQITYGLSWIFLFLPTLSDKGRKQETTAPRTLHVRYMPDESEPFYRGAKGNESLKPRLFFRSRPIAIRRLPFDIASSQMQLQKTKLYIHYVQDKPIV